MWHFFFARSTPCPPYVNNYKLSLEIAKSVDFTIGIGKGEIWSYFAGKDLVVIVVKVFIIPVYALSYTVNHTQLEIFVNRRPTVNRIRMTEVYGM